MMYLVIYILIVLDHIDLIVKAKSAAEREEMNSADFDDEYDLERPDGLDRSMRLKRIIEQVFEENEELLERLKDE